VVPWTTALFADRIAAERSPKRISLLVVDEFPIQRVPVQGKWWIIQQQGENLRYENP
jgi:hypothetical protein